MKQKSFTDIEQSKKLAEILPPESADTLYCVDFDGDVLFIAPKQYSGSFRHQPELIIPCWSLAALLDVLPNKLQIALVINDFQGDRKEKYGIGSVEHDKYDCYAGNPIDACYEMILKLHELNLL